MTNVVKFLSTRSFFQLGAELKREKYDHNTDRNTNRQLWVAFFITFVFFIWAVYALIKYQSVLPGWIVVLGILLLFAPAGPLLTLILVYYSVGSIKDTAAETDITETVTIGEDPAPAYESGGKIQSNRQYRLQKRPYSRHHPYQTHSHQHQSDRLHSHHRVGQTHPRPSSFRSIGKDRQ